MLLKVNQADLYYTSAVSKEEATWLQDYLVQSKICGDSQISMQLTKSGSMRQFRMVVKPGFEKDKGYLATVQELGATLSAQASSAEPRSKSTCATITSERCESSPRPSSNDRLARKRDPFQLFDGCSFERAVRSNVSS